MSLTSGQLINLAQEIAAICGVVPECGEIVPAPIYFVDKSDFISNIGNVSLNTQKERELFEVAFTTITFSKPPTKPARHGGWWTYHFNLYIFRQYDTERLDESITPDEFRKKILKSYFEFINAILGLQTQFGEERPLTIEDDEIRDAIAFLETSGDFIDENEFCIYVPGVRGFSVDIPLNIKVLFREC